MLHVVVLPVSFMELNSQNTFGPLAQFQQSSREQPPPPRDIWKPVNTSSDCNGWIVLLLLLIVAFIVGFVVYVVIKESEFNNLENRVNKLEEAATTSESRTVRRAVDLIGIQRRQDSVPQPALPAPAPSRPPIPERPDWASKPVPKWLQFDTPNTDTVTRLPSEGSIKGLTVAGQRGYEVECNFGGTRAESAKDQIELDFRVNDETGDEYILMQVTKQAYWGRSCVLEWMDSTIDAE